MSSIWDPPDRSVSPELIEAERRAAAEKLAKEQAAAEHAARVAAEAKVARMRAIYAKAAACSLLHEEDSDVSRGDTSDAAPRAVVEPVPDSVPAASPAAARTPSESPRDADRLARSEAERRRFFAELHASLPPALAAWRPGQPIPDLDRPVPPPFDDPGPQGRSTPAGR